MQKCHRCGIIYITSPFENFCSHCGEFLESQGMVEYDERRTATMSEICGRVVHGYPPLLKRRWECKQPRYE